MQKIKQLGWMLFSVQTAFVMLLAYYITKLNVLPKWAVLLVVAFCIAFTLTNMYFICFKHKKIYKVLVVILTAVFCIVAIIPVNVMRHAEYTLNNLQGESNEYEKKIW